MEFVLTGCSASGAEFERLGLVNKALPKSQVLPEALKLAAQIARMSAPVVKIGKQAVLTGEYLSSVLQEVEG
jgi:enoyl-CoA hydratase